MEKNINRHSIFLFVLTVILVFACNGFFFKITEKSEGINFNDKIIMIGDSRTYQIEKEEGLNTGNYHFIAKNGARIDWFEKNGLKELNSYLNTNKNKHDYYIVINMGVNDISHNKKYIEVVDEYFNLFKSLNILYPNIPIYILSVHPVNEDWLHEYWKSSMSSNQKIENFNSYMKKNIINNKNQNLNFCDSYNNVKFNTFDGLHFTYETDQRVIDYVSNKCVKNS